ncbi:MAG: AAA family ATPase [Candidatus Magasanikbacteria bacterium]
MTLTLENIEINQDFEQALDLIDKGESVFITGRAGTGKSTLLQYFRVHTDKEIAVLAPTGIAAVNIGGITIHSLFGFGADITVEKVKREFQNSHRRELFEQLDAIVIDEISMVRADLMDCIDTFLRQNGPNPLEPFGGIQMIFFGDMYQLPPVVKSEEKEIFEQRYDSPYFFDSDSFRQSEFKMVELEKIYRQQDQDFIEILNAVRNKEITDQQLEQLNKQVKPEFDPEHSEMYVHITPTNSKVDKINEERLAKLDTAKYTFQGDISGEFKQTALPTRENLELKIDSQIMLVNNDTKGRWVNGTIGTILDVNQKNDEEDEIVVKTEHGKEVTVTPYTWEMHELEYDENKDELTPKTKGKFTQYPIKLAWAVTIHKSQGKTFDKVVLDTDKGTFAHGQAYVALSRATSLEGLVLKKPIKKKHIWSDWRVADFISEYQYQQAEEDLSTEQKQKILQQAVENEEKVKITYLKTSDKESTRTISPKEVGMLSYRGTEFLGVRCYCHMREAERNFKIRRIIELERV